MYLEMLRALDSDNHFVVVKLNVYRDMDIFGNKKYYLFFVNISNCF